MINNGHDVGAAMETLELLFGQPIMLIKCEIEKAKRLRPLRSDHLEEWAPFAATVRNLVAVLSCDETRRHLSNPILLDELVQKLPPSERLVWSDVAESLHNPTMQDFSDWVMKIAKRASRVVTVPTDFPAGPNQRRSPVRDRRPGKSNILVINASKSNLNDRYFSCTMCSGPVRHAPDDCGEFKKMDVETRWLEVRKRHLCFGCLRGGHPLTTCRNKRECGEKGCVKLHHRMLHGTRQNIGVVPTNRVMVSLPENAATNTANSSVMTMHHSIFRTTNLLLRVIPVELSSGKRSIRTYALLDEGATVTLMDETIAKKLELNGDKSILGLSWYGGNTVTEQSMRVDLRIGGVERASPTFPIRGVRTVRNLELPRQTLCMSELHSKYRHLKHLPIAEYNDVKPTILIGIDNTALGMPRKLVIADAEGLVATKTRLGWVIYGRYMSEKKGESEHCAIVRVTSEVLLSTRITEEKSLDDLYRIVQDFHTVESFGVRSTARPIESTADARARQILCDMTRRCATGFETGLLWAKDDIRLPDSRQMAMNRLLNIENKMSKDAGYADLYRKNMAHFIERGYATKLTPEAVAKITPRTWYLPHFGVVNPNKPGKLRIVFDAAASVRGTSLNDALLTGPDEYASLMQTLFRFRMGSAAVCGDIEEMFLQIKIRKEDQDSQRFLYRNGDRTKPVDTYVMNSMTFGAKCSPYTAQYVKNLNATEFPEADPNAVDAIVNHHYVDDFVMSFATSEDASRTTKAVVEIHRAGGFNLRNFSSNCSAVLRSLGANDETIQVSMDKMEKILGMHWNTLDDTFTFKLNEHKIPPNSALRDVAPTKRNMLSVTMAIYDPFGILNDFTLYAKLLVQEVWSCGGDWDDQVPADIARRWAVWRSELRAIESCRLPRCYSPFFLKTNDRQLHIFADASETAYAAVAYWRIPRADGLFDVSLVASKTRCAPRKLLSVPRLELQAAVLATRLRTMIGELHGVPINRVQFWSDSTTVLGWISSDHRRYKPFVAHRIAEIMDSTGENEWRYIQTDLNVADDATRAARAPKFDAASRWLVGPGFLRLSESYWPARRHEVPEIVDELRPQFVFVSAGADVRSWIDLTRFSSYGRLRRSMGWIVRFAHNARFKKDRIAGVLTADELLKAEIELIRQAQVDCYSLERRALELGVPLERTSELVKLSPQLDDRQIIRLFGRTDAAAHLPFDARRPIILPREHGLTKLIVEYHHVYLKHQNRDALVCAIRQRFWIPRLPGLVRKIIGECQFCKLRAVKPTPPLMGQLPLDRLTPYVRPFSYTGLDYFGPISVTVGRRHEKRWVALFTCLTTRAVHLELAADMSTDSCLLCLRNFMNLRGVPVRIRSDNGTNFVGADKVLRDISKQIRDDRIANELANRGVEWLFNSPSNPEAGGCWERLVRCVKRVLAVSLKETAPRVETLRSLLLEAANVVNSRPLTSIPLESESDEPLTPNHFLLGCASNTQMPGFK